MIVDEQIRRYTEECSKEDSDICVGVGSFMRKNYVIYYKLTGLLKEHYLGLSDLDQRLLMDRINILLGRSELEAMNSTFSMMMNLDHEIYDPDTAFPLKNLSKIDKAIMLINRRYTQVEDDDNNV